MSTFFLDPISGNDANDGTTFANRWKTITTGATAARIAPGDTIRIIASPEPTLLGNATWTNNSRTITLPSAVTATICDCESAWTASTNVTATASTTTFREGTKSANLVVAAGFTTGKLAYFATGTLDLSAYQQVSLMLRSSVGLAAGVLTLNLCSDTTGDVPVHTITLPAVANAWMPVVFDNAGALSSAIASVSVSAVSDPGSPTLNLDNIVACKASASADSLTHVSLIGKVVNLSWAATTAYVLGDRRRPSVPNRNGMVYQVTTAGTTDASEPTWPTDLGQTVTDGSVVWTAFELEDTWYPIASISGTTVKLEAGVTTASGADASVRGAYQGLTETIATYKREPTPEQNRVTSGSTTAANTVTDTGTAGSYITFSGGWDRTAMSAQTGESWWDGGTGFGSAFANSVRNYIALDTFGAARYAYGVNVASGGNTRLRNIHSVANSNQGLNTQAHTTRLEFSNVVLKNNVDHILAMCPFTGRCLQCDGASNGVLSVPSGWTDINYMNYRGNGFGATGMGAASTTTGINLRIRNLVTANNNGTPISGAAGEIHLFNPSFGEATPIANFGTAQDGYVHISKYNQTADDHRHYTESGTIQSTTAQRNTGSGIAWVFNPTATKRGDVYPLRLPLARIACVANVARSLTIYTRRDSTNIKGRLMLRGGQIAGVGSDVSVDCTPTINTWTQSSTLTFTPTEEGVVEVEFLAWDGVGTTNSFWIDDLAIS